MLNNQILHTIINLWVTPHEENTDFRMLLLRHSKNGLMISGLLGILATSFYIIAKFLFFEIDFSWTYNVPETRAVVMIDKIILLILSILMIALSKANLSLSSFRLIGISFALISAFLILADDIYNQDISSSSGYLTILLLIVSSCIPFKPWQVLVLGASMILMLYPGINYIPELIGARSMDVNTSQVTYLVMISLIVVGITMYLYHSRYTTYMARRKAEGFIDQLFLDDEEESPELSVQKEQDYLSGKLPLLVNPIDVPSSEQVFLDKVKVVIEQHLGDSNFGVEWLAHEVAISPRQLQRRLKSSIGLTAGALIRVMRLQRAAQYLNKDAGNVNEIAYKVGFNDAGYFSRIFKKMHGVNPSEYHTP